MGNVIKDIYGNHVKDLSSMVVVSAKESQRLLNRAKALNLKCTCLTCNPTQESTNG